MLSLLVQLLGLAAFVLGAFLIYVPAGFFVSGGALLLIGQALDGVTLRKPKAETEKAA